MYEVISIAPQIYNEVTMKFDRVSTIQCLQYLVANHNHTLIDTAHSSAAKLTVELKAPFLAICTSKKYLNGTGELKTVTF